jgi:hypothetical protein
VVEVSDGYRVELRIELEFDRPSERTVLFRGTELNDGETLTREFDGVEVTGTVTGL